MRTEENDTRPVIDTSKMSAGERAALEMAESARDATARRAGFGGSLFLGRPEFAQLCPFPEQSLEDRDQGDAFLKRLDAVLADVDADAIDRDGEVPDAIIERLAEIGAFGIKVPTKFGGLGLSQTNYARAAMRLGSVCGSLTALISAHQSIGVPQPLLLFGSDEQKRRYLPRVAAGTISAFALTEPDVGSDPARMQTRAEPTEDGGTFVLNGEKLWCTNGTRAGVIVVMAKTPSGEDGRTRVTAFIVETDWPGVSVVTRCHFMGLRALYNGVMRFENVRVPRENIVLGEGKGLKVALTTLNTGRITLPAACTGLARECVAATTRWANRRVQWGAPIVKHAAVADKVARMRADTYAMEAMTLAVSGLVDAGKRAGTPADIRIEAAMAKLWATERCWRIVDDTMQVRGGRGYETAASLRARGDEDPVPVERWMRDARINTIFEGSSEIMRLFIAREILDPHLKVGAAVFNTTLPPMKRVAAAARAGLFYAGWYPRQWLPSLTPAAARHLPPELRAHARWIQATSKRLARALFHAMLRHGPKLDKQQLLLGRLVDIGTELFAATAAIGHAKPESAPTAHYFCQLTRARVSALFHEHGHNTDAASFRFAQS